MSNIFKSWFSPGSYLGVDIGTNSIKAVEIQKTSSGPKLLNYCILESYSYLHRPNEAIQTSSLSLSAKETANLLKTLIAKGNLKTKNVIASIPAFSAFINFLEIPDMPESETLNALKFQVPRYIPLPLEQISVDWSKVGSYKNDKGMLKQQILLTAIPHDTVSKYNEIFKLAGLHLYMLEVESVSLIRAVAEKEEDPVIIVDIGSRSTNIVITAKGYLRYSYQTDYAGISLTQAIAKGLGIDMKRAEELKKQRGIVLRAEEYELSTLTLPFLDAIINEVTRAKAIYEKESNLPVKKVILSGGGANLLGLPKYIKDQIGLEVLIGNPFTRTGYPEGTELIWKEIAPALAVAIGLGIKEFV